VPELLLLELPEPDLTTDDPELLLELLETVLPDDPELLFELPEPDDLTLDDVELPELCPDDLTEELPEPEDLSVLLTPCELLCCI
jgi:hypothetical protein